MIGKSLGPEGQNTRKGDICALTSLGCLDKRTVVSSVGQGAVPRAEQKKKRLPQPKSRPRKNVPGKRGGASSWRAWPCAVVCLLFLLISIERVEEI